MFAPSSKCWMYSETKCLHQVLSAGCIVRLNVDTKCLVFGEL